MLRLLQVHVILTRSATKERGFGVFSQATYARRE